MTLKEKTFQLVTHDRAVTKYPIKRLNISGLLRLALLVAKVAELRAPPYLRTTGV